MAIKTLLLEGENTMQNSNSNAENNAEATFNNAFERINNAESVLNHAIAPTDTPTDTPTDHFAEPRKEVSRTDILDKAKAIVTGDREQQYGKPEDNFAIIAGLWSAYKGVSFTPLDVAMMMALLKIARIRTGVGTVDSFVDLAGYAACGGEIAGRS